MRAIFRLRIVAAVLDFAIAAAAVVALSGCQRQPTTVSGAVTVDGRPLSVSKESRGTVVFQPDGGRGTMAIGLLDSAGQFSLATGSSPEVAEGKYYVTVSVTQLLPKKENEEQGAKLITPARYASANESGLSAEVKPGENHIRLDLSSADASAEQATDEVSEPGGGAPSTGKENEKQAGQHD